MSLILRERKSPYDINEKEGVGAVSKVSSEPKWAFRLRLGSCGFGPYPHRPAGSLSQLSEAMFAATSEDARRSIYDTAPHAMKANRRLVIRIVLDALMAIDFVLVMATALVAEAPHEFLGMALFVLVIAHIILNRKWIAALTRGRWTVMRVVQVVAMVGLVVCVVGQIASALVLSEHALAFLPAIPGAAWARRAHMLCSYWSFVFAFAHAGLHMKSMVARVGRRVSVPSAALWLIRIVVAGVAVFGAVSRVSVGLPAYLTAQVQFALAEPNVALSCARWASIAVLIAGVFYCIRKIAERGKGIGASSPSKA